ncbi:MAG: NAD(P)-dependent glycerol-3-phosphate dehydrogenase [Armatimonadetes bacterium]|nr:NAD(P)-dependent glycerol-3-phosphate dehydrogenase [Armatimonadota bacterium]
MDVAVLGAGSWGTSLAILMARNGLEVTLFGRDHAEITVMRHTHENMKYLPGFAFPKGLTVNEFKNYQGAPVAYLAVPSSAVREVLAELQGETPIVIVATKGLETSTGMVVTAIVEQCLPNAALGVISGPNLAVEIVQGIPTAAIAASKDPKIADRIRANLMCPSFRVYASEDVVGVEIAGALKNVLAIGGGISDGLGFGDNTKGALLARGLKEMITYGMAHGGKLETFLGIAGVGDLFATAVSKLSRNYRLGYALGTGHHISEALQTLGQVAEGVNTSEAVAHVARHEGIQIPVFETIDSVIREKIAPKAAVGLLMERFTREEGLDFGKA